MSRKKTDKSQAKVKKSPYDPGYVAEIREIEKEVAEGKFTRLDPNKSIWKNLM